MKIVFATNNKHKIEEVQAMLPDGIQIITLLEAGITEEIPEPFDTFRENAMAKAKYVHERLGLDCFAEDSGLCVNALDNSPGVFSARYAGMPSNDDNNNILLLRNLEGIHNRSAYYQSTIALIWKSNTYYFEGKCMGKIHTQCEGNNGFGYDPLFIPEGYEQTFGNLPFEVKLKVSHRKVATALLCEEIKKLAF